MQGEDEMKVTLVGTGCGDPGTMTTEVKNAIGGADILIGAPRLMEAVDDYTNPGVLKVPEIRPASILDAIKNMAKKNDDMEEINVCVRCCRAYPAFRSWRHD